jgi:predicted Zn-dependent peptidase
MRAQRSTPLRLSRRAFLGLAGVTAATFLTSPRWAGAAATSVVSRTLPNGLLVIVQERPSAGTVALQHTALAGVRDDGAHPGSTVLTSRMLLQGTPRYPSEIELKRAATLAGGDLGRGTTSEYSNISCVLPATAAELGFDLLSDAVINPLFDPSAFDGQQHVAMQDLAQRSTTPAVLIGDLFQQTLFGGQPLGFSPFGTTDDIAALTLDIIRQTQQRLWGGANSVLTVVGTIRAEDAFSFAGSYFAGLDAGAANVRQPTQAQPPATAQIVQANAGHQAQFRVGFVAPALPDADRYPIAVLTGMMSGFSGRLLRELRTKLGIAYTPSASYAPYSDAGAWFASVAVDPPNLDQALDVTRSAIQAFRDVQADSSEVSNAIEAIAGTQILAGESNASVAGQLAVQQALGDVSVEEYVRRIRLVTPADVQRVATTYFDLNHSLTAIVGPPSDS